ncbi:WD40-repeat-containing domain protein [Radiomyces spectabilis]|uniref:WD40-repeat-containing domain protein n=1 Tax=Radiomyces spectabilis TaxID=64574 RepID=UPI00221EE0C8|nr:WD40-repeat-containing domain protein [Radiomyces spectabilis]KAI8364348.1 WD40-repeat-containing domain protein [Radiomyces spectabilis]
MKSKLKSERKFSRLLLSQTLLTAASAYASSISPATGRSGDYESQGAIWAMKFSKDGRYLATGGQSCVLRVWKVLDAPYEEDSKKKDTMKVFEEKPAQEYHGHVADILDISWSKNNFLLSSSMDKTVRLWHISRQECLCVFRHLDFVTGIAFHPSDDRFFLSGSLDCKLRLWSIPEKRVAFWNEVPDGNMITAVGFTLDGRTACAGSHVGEVFFYDTKELKYNTQITIKKRNQKKGRKITGIEAMPGMPPGEEKLLITSNDSHVFSDDGSYIVSGSEDCDVYLWNTEQENLSPFYYLQEGHSKTIAGVSQLTEQMLAMYHSDDNRGSSKRRGGWLRNGSGDNHVRNRSEHFEAHQQVVTSTVFAPMRTRQLLGRTGTDIIYNYTPVYTSIDKPVNDRQDSEHVMRTSFSTSSQLHGSMMKEFEEADLEARRKYSYSEGQIIVSADFHGCLKVWRMDCGVYPTKRNSMDAISLGSKNPLMTMSSIHSNHSVDGDHKPASVKSQRQLFGIFSSTKK